MEADEGLEEGVEEAGLVEELVPEGCEVANGLLLTAPPLAVGAAKGFVALPIVVAEGLEAGAALGNADVVLNAPVPQAAPLPKEPDCLGVEPAAGAWKG